MPQTLGPLQEEWLTLLESGRFKQAQRVLSKAPFEAKCCLGVFCVIGIEKGFVQKADPVFQAPHCEVFCPTGEPSETHSSTLPDSVRRRLGMHVSGMDLCIEINDSDNRSFKEIATAVRKKPEKFFSHPA